MERHGAKSGKIKIHSYSTDNYRGKTTAAYEGKGESEVNDMHEWLENGQANEKH